MVMFIRQVYNVNKLWSVGIWSALTLQKQLLLDVLKIKHLFYQGDSAFNVTFSK
jgi:hypothetical protein